MEVFACIAYCSANQTLCAGTNQGRLFTWKKVTSNEINDVNVQPNYTFEYAENAWQLHNISMVRGAIKHCAWGVCDINKPCVMLNCISNVYILKVANSRQKQYYKPYAVLIKLLPIPAGTTIAFGTLTGHLVDTKNSHTTHRRAFE